MKFLKNTEIAKKYNVSRPTVGKWIIAAKNKDNLLELTEIDGVSYILDSKHNQKELENLKNKGSKFRNKIGYELLTVDDRFYKVFSESQSIEIITSLESDHIIPLKYTYFDQGAKMWDEYVKADMEDSEFSTKKEEKILITSSLDYLQLKLQKYKKVNIIDIGPGNGYASKPVIDKLLDLEKKVQYTGIDISTTMLEILETNLSTWYPNLNTEYQALDIDFDIFRNLLFFNRHSFKEDSCNLILFFGYTIGNFFDRNRIYKNFYDSMNRGDMLWFNCGLEGEGELEELQRHAKNSFVVAESSWIPEYLGIKPEMYSLEVKFNTRIESYTLVLKLNKDIGIRFNLRGSDKMVNFDQNDEIIVWNYCGYTVERILEEITNVGFNIANLSCYPDYSEAAILCEIK
jgi:hypothetical protein